MALDASAIFDTGRLGMAASVAAADSIVERNIVALWIRHITCCKAVDDPGSSYPPSGYSTSLLN